MNEKPPMPESPGSALLEVQDLKTHFPVRGGVFLRPVGFAKAVDGVSFKLFPGETLGLVGESGCGKTTLGKTIVRLLQPTAGRVLFEGTDLTGLRQRELKPIRRHLQMVFQDPAESLNARHTVGTILEEPFIIHQLGGPEERRARVAELLAKVGLPGDAAHRYPFEFSGGQRQRIGIARALALNPRLIICDEPVSALDVSIQGQVLNLLLDLQHEFRLSYLFIAHNLAVVKHISDRIAVMYLGRIVELGQADEIYFRPRHPYTQALLAAIPEPDPRRSRKKSVLSGDIPSPIHPPSGCPFHTRCPHVTDLCRAQTPALRETAAPASESHVVACHYDLPAAAGGL
jgi:peptide/nickel transport system ATP-binding protein